MLMDSMLREQSDINSKLAGLKSPRRWGWTRTSATGRVPAEVQSMLSRDGRYLGAKERLDNVEDPARTVEAERTARNTSQVRRAE
jgi:hypothetical protein